MDAPAAIPLLLVGDRRRREFREVLRAGEGRAEWQFAAGVPQALEMLRETATPPAAVVLVQARPGEYADAEIDLLRRGAPLTPLLVLLGSWCEGETRSGRPWPGVQRVYWHQWEPRLAAELDRIAAGRCPNWGLPLTAAPDEFYERMDDAAPAQAAGWIAIAARHAVAYQTLADALATRGYGAAWLTPQSPRSLHGATAALWDATGLPPGDMVEIAALAREFAPAPLLVLLAYPRPEDVDRVRAAGAWGVVSKPFLLDDLFRQLEQAIAAR